MRNAIATVIDGCQAFFAAVIVSALFFSAYAASPTAASEPPTYVQGKIVSTEVGHVAHVDNAPRAVVTPVQPAAPTKVVTIPDGYGLYRLGAKHGTSPKMMLDLNPEYRPHPDFVPRGAQIRVLAQSGTSHAIAPAALVKKSAPAATVKPVLATSPSGWFSPLGAPGRCSSRFGASRPGGGHSGLDMPRPVGTPIHSVASGTVLQARGNSSGYGQVIVIKYGDGTIAEYGHVDTYIVEAGQRVAANQVIGTVGNEGESTGPHLHLTFTKGAPFNAANRFNPETAMAARGIKLCA